MFTHIHTYPKNLLKICPVHSVIFGLQVTVRMKESNICMPEAGRRAKKHSAIRHCSEYDTLSRLQASSCVKCIQQITLVNFIHQVNWQLTRKE